MQREQLLSLLDQQALDAFEAAKRLALSNGGILSPLHILVAVIESQYGSASVDSERLLTTAREALAARYSGDAESITVSKETQSIIVEAGRLAEHEGLNRATPSHLLRSAINSEMVKNALGEEALLKLNALSSSGAGELGTTGDQSFPQTAGSVVTAPTEARALTGVLSEYCADLAEESRESSSHPFVGREREITAVLETLCRKLKSNPLLIGKPGVGKTALVTAVAARLCGGDVPKRLRGKRILEVSRLRLLADAKFAGDTEERLKRLLEEVRRSGDIILFFDEIHTLLGAGGSAGTGDIANLLKSSLSKGEITCIGATTLAEYYKYIARDEALARRFSTITIEEPSSDEARRILLQTRETFESYHGVKIDDDTIALIVELADRYLQSRSFPDKAFDLLDKAAAKATL